MNSYSARKGNVVLLFEGDRDTFTVETGLRVAEGEGSLLGGSDELADIEREGS